MHIDPKAPADSPQHPANFGRGLSGDDPVLTDAFAIGYADLIEHFGTAPERAGVERGEDGPALDDLRKRKIQHDQETAERVRLVRLYGPAHTDLLIEYGSPEERAEGAPVVPTQVLLDRQREAAEIDALRGGAVEFPVQLGSEAPEELKRPPKDANRARWEAYAKALDPALTDDDLKPITVAGLREMTAYQDGTTQADA